MRPLIFPLSMAVLAGILATPTANARLAAAPVQVAAVGDAPPSARARDKRPNTVVRRIQALLSKIGIFQGAVDGVMGPRTEQAIRTFQKSRGLKVDGQATEDLAHTLETDEKVDDLLKRLETVRKDKVETARQALLSDPRTRHLIDPNAKDDIADPTRDAAPCFDAPTPSCLLHESVESAKAVFKDELRDWALGEILAAQARAGLSNDAMATARRISDPRLVMVALREIAEALADAGEPAAAMNAADIIPDADKRLEAYGTIASIQAGLNRDGRLDKVVGRIEAMLDTRGNSGETVRYHAQFAVLYHSVGKNAAARRFLDEAERLARRIVVPRDRSAALRHVAIARAEMADPDGALSLLADLTTPSDRTPVLSSAAHAHARNGAVTRALNTAAEIESGRYRAVALSNVAAVLAHGGATAKAADAIEQARAIVGDIKLPYARSYAASRVTMALLDMATANGEGFQAAIRAADTIEDDTLRAYALWAIATEQRRAGDADNAAFTETLAREAVNAITSRLSRVWLYADLAVSFAGAGEVNPAWAAFNSGLGVARDLTNAWGRARALAKLSNALSVLTEPDGKTRRAGKVVIPERPIPYDDPPK